MSNEEFQKLVLEKLLSLDNGQEKLFNGQERLVVRMDNIESAMATKEDIKVISGRVESIESTMATKEDIKVISGRVESIESTMATKEDIKVISGRVENIESTMATKEDIKVISGRVENIESTMVTKTEFFSAIDEQQKDVKMILRLIDDKMKKSEDRMDCLDKKIDNIARETNFLIIKLAQNEDYIRDLKLIK